MNVTDADIATQVQQIIIALAASRGYEGLPPETSRSLKDVGFDSLLTVELVAQLEKKFGVEIPDEALTPAAFATLGSTLDVIRPLL
jgi:acyl carrier protein